MRARKCMEISRWIAQDNGMYDELKLFGSSIQYAKHLIRGALSAEKN